MCVAKNVKKYHICRHQMRSFKPPNAQTRFRPKLRPGPRWGRPLPMNPGQKTTGQKNHRTKDH